MSEPIARYSFLPWLREGLANNITQADGADVKLRASVPVTLTVSSVKVDGSAGVDQDIDKAIALYGPGDIIGIDSKAIIKTEPHNWISNFEPNFLPYVDFYVEDFAWRYTPAKADANRLRPWITLVVLKEDEFEDGQNMKEKPLPYFRMKEGKKAAEIFPDHTQLWAWAHVHVNTDLSNDAPLHAIDDTQVNQAASALIDTDPDQAYCRVLCPRKLEANKAYHAFVIPTFESGRLAGLGADIPGDLKATTCGWENEGSIEFPYYYRWFFITGEIGDFEYLVNLLKPRPANKRVGVRDIDVMHPGSNLPPIDDASLQGVLKLGGALRVPVDTLEEPDRAEVQKYDLWDEPYPHRFTTAMATRVNLADDYVDPTKRIADVNQEANILIGSGQGDPDPVITSPLYGKWHALQQRLLLQKNGSDMPHYKNWIHELNLDPRFRTAAGLGTKVIQKGQEEYMLAAWEQVGKVIEANNKLRMAVLARETAAKFYGKHFTSLTMQHALFMTAPIQKRIVYKNVTLYQHRELSIVPPALTSGTFRALIKPRGVLMKKLDFNAGINASNLIERIDAGQVVVAPPKVDPPGAIKLSDLAESAGPRDAPPFIIRLLSRYKLLRYLPLLLLLIAFLIVLVFFGTAVGWGIFAALAAGAVYAFTKLNQWANELRQQEMVSQSSQVPEAVDTYPKRPGFVITQPGSDVRAPVGTTDSQEAVNFKRALKEAFTVVSVKFPEPAARVKLNYRTLAEHAIKSIDPRVTFQKRIFGAIQIPDHIRNNLVEGFSTIMAYPAIDVPMYKPLADLSSELFLPNINLIEENSITLLENNQKFIEAYMVGINHEMSREMLWREYPTDLKGTCFRQFWDVSGFLQTDPTQVNNRDVLYDIPPVHQWSKTDTTRTDPQDSGSPLKNELGQHNHRAAASGKTQIVLVVRGELLKKYPTTVVYAHKADWGMINNVKSTDADRVFVELTAEEEKNPPTEKLKTPLFSAKIEPDIYFFGFDLDDEEARGTLNPTSVTDDPGWFFVLKERAGELRFGLDIEKAKDEDGQEMFLNWNQFSWQHVGTADGANIVLEDAIVVNPTNSPGYDEFRPIEEDKQARWSRDTNSAELAYILNQVPVLVGVHAARMLPK